MKEVVYSPGWEKYLPA